MDDAIQGFHAHVYFDAGTVETARAVCEDARHRFGLDMGRMHEKPVGPHPMWSCQLAFGPKLFGEVLAWLAMNRRGLTVFTHPDTGDDLVDHRDRAIWMGTMPALKLGMFETSGETP
jgi:DOPA 4,5-dioxygenase